MAEPFAVRRRPPGAIAQVQDSHRTAPTITGPNGTLDSVATERFQLDLSHSTICCAVAALFRPALGDPALDASRSWQATLSRAGCRRRRATFLAMRVVLVVDDDEDLLPILSEALTMEGWRALGVRSASSALRVALSSALTSC